MIQLVQSVDEAREGARTAPLSEDDETRRSGFLTALLSVQLQSISAAAVSTCVHFNTKHLLTHRKLPVCGIASARDKQKHNRAL